MAGVFDLIWINKLVNDKLCFASAFVDSFIRIFSIDVVNCTYKMEKEL